MHLVAERLCKTLAALELTRGLARAETDDPGGPNVIPEPGDNRRIRPDDHEVDVL